MPTLPVSPSTTNLSVSTVKSSPAADAKTMLNTPPVSTVNALEASNVVVPKSTDVAVATPKVGVVKVGEVAKTKAPEPCSSDITPSSWREVVAAKSPKVLEVVAIVPVVGKVTLVAPVDVKVMELAPEVAKVEPSTNVNVAPVAGAVIVILFIEVAVATDRDDEVEAERVVNAPVFGVVDPIVPGTAQVYPPNCFASKAAGTVPKTFLGFISASVPIFTPKYNV